MFGTTRTGRIGATVAAVMLAGLVAAPAAGAVELPPAPVQPGFENVVIAPRPLAAPNRPAPTVSTVKPAAAATAVTKKTCTVKVRVKGGKKITVKTCTVRTKLPAQRTH